MHCQWHLFYISVLSEHGPFEMRHVHNFRFTCLALLSNIGSIVHCICMPSVQQYTSKFLTLKRFPIDSRLFLSFIVASPQMVKPYEQ